MGMNVFRILGDVSHTISKCILIWSIHSNRSAEGVSLLTQILYAVVFCCRYLDLFAVAPSRSIWNFVLKIFYITSSFYIIFLMTRVYARTREREKAWKLGSYVTAGSLLAAAPVYIIFRSWQATTFREVMYTFSLILESVCVLPQLLLLRQTTVPTVIDSFYLLTLGSYRAFYILNWIYRAAHHDKPEAISVIFGVVQTAFYADFAWVYWTRQRVKLRGGGVVDSEDLRKGWLVKKVIDTQRTGAEEEEDPEAGHVDQSNDHIQGNNKPRNANRWGARGVSISADDTLHDHHNTRAKLRPKTGQPDSAAMLSEDVDDDAFLDDDDDDDDAPILDEPGQKVLNSNQEWRDA